jgi:hypothetical protein
MANKTDTTGIFFELIHIKALAGWHCASPGRGIAFYGMKAVDRRLGGDILDKRDGRVREDVEGRSTRHAALNAGSERGLENLTERAHGI